MKKRTNNKTWMIYCHPAKVLKVSLFVLLLLFIAAQLSVDRYLIDANNKQSSRVQDLIIEAVRGLRKEAVVDGPSGKVYLPDAHLVLPPYPANVRGVLYSYDHSGEAINDDELLITSTSALGYGIARVNSANSIEGSFNAVPKMQACSRQIAVTFKQNSELVGTGYRQVYAKKLADGREIFMYLDKGCEENSAELIDYLKQLQSY